MSFKKQITSFAPVQPFTFELSYSEIDRLSPNNTFDSHVHNSCEVYINLTGDVSFMVENQIYPIRPGNIIITRPFEYHHCIYHSNAPHKHFCIWFSAEGNEHLLSRFFDRKAGEQNLLTLDAQDTQTLSSLCFSMMKPAGEVEQYFRFFQFLHLLQKTQVTQPVQGYPQDVATALDYITRHLTDPLTVEALAQASFVSVNTLERHFAAHLNMSPSVYIKKKRLAIAAKYLAGGCTVAEACEKSGVSDYSYFIALFRKTYGLTPLQYQKKYQHPKK